MIGDLMIGCLRVCSGSAVLGERGASAPCLLGSGQGADAPRSPFGTDSQSKKVKSIVNEMRESQALSMPGPPGVAFSDGPPPGRGPGFDSPEFLARFDKMREAQEK